MWNTPLLTATYLLKFQILCFKTRWAVTADIFLLSPQKTPSTRRRHQISENRLRRSSAPSTPLMGRAGAPNAHCTNSHRRPSSQTPALSVITLRRTFVQDLKHPEELGESLAYGYDAGYSDGAETGLQHSLGFVWEAGTKHLHKKSSWAPPVLSLHSTGRERWAGRYPRSEILSRENTSRRAPPT